MACDAVQSRLLIANQPAIPMIEPKRVLRALAEHWALLEPLCEHFD
ncbi:MAG: Mks condensin complex protein MksB, partial [Pseudomonas sp.]